MNMGNIKVLETRAEKLVRHLNDEIAKLYKATETSEALSSDNAAKLDAYTKIASVQFMINKMSMEFSSKIQSIGVGEDKEDINRALMELAQIVNAVINKNPEVLELGLAEGARELAINMMSLICLIMADTNDIYGMFKQDHIAPKPE